MTYTVQGGFKDQRVDEVTEALRYVHDSSRTEVATERNNHAIALATSREGGAMEVNLKTTLTEPRLERIRAAI
ncbi:MAG: hypothetical protein ACTHZ9_12095 [Leucobacter sp.]